MIKKYIHICYYIIQKLQNKNYFLKKENIDIKLVIKFIFSIRLQNK